MRKSQAVAPLLLAMLYSCRSAPQVITIDSTPSNAVITIDNQFVGNTPVVYTLPKDKRRASNLVIRAEKSGYEESAKLVRKQGKRFEPTVYLKLERLPMRPQTQFVGIPQAAPAAAPNITISTGQQNANTTTAAPPVINNVTGPNNNNAHSSNNSSNGGGNGSGNR